MKKNLVKSKRVKLYLSIVLGTLLLILYVGGKAVILSLEEQVRELKRKHVVVDGQIKLLEIEAINLESAGRIKRIAHEQLGMVIPEGAPETLF